MLMLLMADNALPRVVNNHGPRKTTLCCICLEYPSPGERNLQTFVVKDPARREERKKRDRRGANYNSTNTVGVRATALAGDPQEAEADWKKMQK